MNIAGLNEAQHKAVVAGDGPVLVLAGAGSGKTMVIVERLAWLIREQGVDPRSILALTFTNKAAGEMRARVCQRLDEERLSAWLGTFHSFGLYLLRREIGRLGRPDSFTVFDDADQLSLMKRLIKDLEPGLERVGPREALGWISRRKQSLDIVVESDTEEPNEKTCRVLWNRYHESLIRASAVDFDDLLVLSARLLRDHEEVRRRYGRRYRYVHIDEYQDTNHAQYEIARLLTEEHGNLFVVGDEDQSIYSWRGATIRNILDFERDFPNARVFRLEQNYRSTEPILSAANAVVSHNSKRHPKTLWTARKGGDPVRLYLAKDAEDEARFVAEELAAAESLDGSAVLYRTNAQARLIEEALRHRNLGYVVVGGVKFYSRKEIKDILAYLRLMVNTSDDASVRRVLNVPRRGIGDTTLERIEEYAQARNCPLFDVLREIGQDHTLGPRVREAIGHFILLVDDLALEARQGLKVEPVVKELIDRTGYRDYIRHSDEQDFRARLEVVDEFISGCADYDRNDPKGLMSFLQDLSLLTDVDEWDPRTPSVTLMTCHSAKGLEFDRVYLIGLEEGFLPHAISLESDDGLEEERRLCYVAMTRARRRLTLTAARQRTWYGENTGREPSRFIGEIPRDRLERIEPDRERLKKKLPVPQTARAEEGLLKSGTRVRHAKFGEGVIVYTSGSGPKLKARIQFKVGKARDFVVAATPLEVLKDAIR